MYYAKQGIKKLSINFKVSIQGLCRVLPLNRLKKKGQTVGSVFVLEKQYQKCVLSERLAQRDR